MQVNRPRGKHLYFTSSRNDFFFLILQTFIDSLQISHHLSDPTHLPTLNSPSTCPCNFPPNKTKFKRKPPNQAKQTNKTKETKTKMKQKREGGKNPVVEAVQCGRGCQAAHPLVLHPHFQAFIVVTQWSGLSSPTPAAKPDDLSSIPGTYMTKQVVLWSPHTYHGMHMPPQIVNVKT